MNEQLFSLSEFELIPLFEALTLQTNTMLTLGKFPCVLMSGEMGAGKTTLVREWMQFSGSTDLVNSPTYSLHNLYELKDFAVHHFDLYRVKETREIENLGFDEIWGKEGISFIEWWQIADSLLPINYRIYLSIEETSSAVRSYSLRTNMI